MPYKLFNKRKITVILLCLLFAISFLLRSFLIRQNLFFGPEQGIDFLVIKQLVVSHKLTLIGSKTDINGIFHGPIYYYLASIPFFFSRGNPLIVALFFIFLNCLTVFFLFDLGRSISNKRIGIIAAILFTVSWNCIVYARWLSNPPLSIPLSALFFALLYRFIKGNNRCLLFGAIVFGLLNQSEFLNILFFFPIAIGFVMLYLPVFRKQNKWYVLLCALIAIFTSVGTYILFDLKHQFLITKSIISLTKGSSGYHITFLQGIIATLSGFVSAYSQTIFPLSFYISVVILIVAMVVLFLKSYRESKNILLLCLLLPPVILIILHHAILDQFFVALLPLFLILTALTIDLIWRKSAIFGIILLTVIICTNIYIWSRTIPQNNSIFFQSTQLDLRLSDQVRVIDRIYQEAEGKPFSVQAYTIPYWEQEAWQYLFASYGLQTYGYQPVPEKARLLFVIIQNDPSDKTYQENWLKNTVSTWGTLEKTFKQGALTVEELKVEHEK